jgi:hypothetical protein
VLKDALLCAVSSQHQVKSFSNVGAPVESFCFVLERSGQASECGEVVRVTNLICGGIRDKETLSITCCQTTDNSCSCYRCVDDWHDVCQLAFIDADVFFKIIFVI